MGIALLSIGKPFIPQANDLLPFAGDFILVLTIVSVLIAPFFSRKSNASAGAVTLVGLIAALASVCAVGVPTDLVGFHFRGTLLFDPFSVGFKIILLIFVIGIVVMRLGTGFKRLHTGDGPEFFCLLLGATLGLSLMSSTTHLLMIFMTIELASFASYVLAGFRKTDRLGAEASLKYVLFGAASSGVMLYGLSMLFGLLGTLQLDQVARSIHQADALTWVAVLAILVGVGFKIASVPFHFWCPDVFEGASVEVTAFLSVASKSAALILAYRLVTLISGTLVPASTLATLLSTAAICTMTLGNTAAIAQVNMKRLLAYSSIAHAGYMLCVLVLAGREHAGTSLLFYIAVYAVMNLGAFMVVSVVEDGLAMRAKTRERATFSGATLSDFAGLARRSPVLAGSMFICLLSLVGLPPVAGFFAKLNLLLDLARVDRWVLLIALVVNTVVSLYVYLRVARAMYLTPDATGDVPPKASSAGQLLAAVCAVALIAMFAMYDRLWGALDAFGSLLKP